METSYKFKIYPDEEQREYLNNNFRSHFQVLAKLFAVCRHARTENKSCT